MALRERNRFLVLALVSSISLGQVQAGPTKFLEAVDKAMKDYGTDLQAEGDANLATMKTIGGKLMHPTKWKELGTDVDAGMKAYGGALTKTGDDALENTKAMVKLLLSVRTYIPDFILKAWDAAVARFKAAAGGASAEASSAWAGDAAPPADPSSGEPDVPGGLPSADSTTQASSIRAPGRTLSDSDRDRLLGQWIDMRTSAASLIRMSGKCKDAGKADVHTAMQSTEQTVRGHDRTFIHHLAINPKACLEFTKSVDRLDHESALVMADVVSELNRIYLGRARARKPAADVKPASEALTKLKAKLASR